MKEIGYQEQCQGQQGNYYGSVGFSLHLQKVLNLVLCGRPCAVRRPSPAAMISAVREREENKTKKRDVIEVRHGS